MRVCLLVSELPRTDPADARGQLASALGERHDVTLALTESRPGGRRGARFGDARAVAVEAAVQDRFDLAVATSWDTTVRLLEVPADRHAFWVDELGHHRLGRWQVERIAAA